MKIEIIKQSGSELLKVRKKKKSGLFEIKYYYASMKTGRLLLWDDEIEKIYKFMKRNDTKEVKTKT